MDSVQSQLQSHADSISAINADIKELSAATKQNTSNIDKLATLMGAVHETTKEIKADLAATVRQVAKGRETDWGMIRSLAVMVVVVGGALWGIAIRPLAKDNEVAQSTAVSAITKAEKVADQLADIRREQAATTVALREIETQFDRESQLKFLRIAHEHDIISMLWREMKGYDPPPIARYMYGPEKGVDR